jgi:hypothetical protein
MSVTDQSQQLASLYETDFAQWVESTVQLLRKRQFADIDLENLIEEIEALSRRDKREIRSRLIKLLSHLLKHAFQPESRSSSWISTIIEQRRQIILILEDSPSLREYLTENYAGCYTKARKEAADETGLELITFPDRCPFTETDVLTEGWLP